MDFIIGDRVTLVSADNENEILIDLIGASGTISRYGPFYTDLEPGENGCDYYVTFDDPDGKIDLLVWGKNLVNEEPSFLSNIPVDEYL